MFDGHVTRMQNMELLTTKPVVGEERRMNVVLLKQDQLSQRSD